MSLLGGVVALQRQAHQQLPATQIGPATGSRIQRIGEIIGLRHEMFVTCRDDQGVAFGLHQPR